MHNALLKTKECMLNEIEKLNGKGGYDDRDLDNLMKATKVLINIEGIKGMEEYADNSYYGMSKGMNPESFRRSYDGMSMGMHYPHMMPNGSWDGRMNPTYNYENRSNHRIEDRMSAGLEQQMDMAQSEYERNKIMAEIRHIRENSK